MPKKFAGENSKAVAAKAKKSEKAEAEKLRMKVEEASLMAAKAAEEAEEKVKMIAKEAMKEANVEPLLKPIRGGTDGAQLSYMGLPCPNIFAGGHNFHGKYEYVPLESMQKAVMVIVKICELTAIQIK